MASFSTPLSGLDASSEELSVISNNLANMNTVGFKSSDTSFQDLFYDQVGSTANGNPQQIGVGTSVASVEGNFSQGTLQTTGTPTDVAITGNGFFIASNNGTQEYTRAGNFTLGSTGELLTVDGANVMGYQATNGVIASGQALSALSIPLGITTPASATSTMQLLTNLDAGAGTAVNAASQQTGTGIAAATTLQTGGVLALSDGTNSFSYTTLAGNTMASVVAAINGNANFTASLTGDSLTVTAKNGNPVTFSTNSLTDAATGKQAEAFVTSGQTQAAGTFSTPVTVYDSLGAAHVLTANFTKTASNTWSYTMTVPAADLGQTGNPVTVKSGTLTFNGSGQLMSPASNPSIAINGLADGAANLNVSWNLINSNGTSSLTQLSAASGTSSTQQNGYASGTLQSYSVGGNGTIEGVFNNGQTIALGQIALASFANEQGLMRSGSNNYVAGLSSGQPTIGAPTTGGLGSLQGGALEVSNVDLATEFSSLIVAERYYQANAQALTTLDQVSQSAESMIQNG
jgi:flagellar hook protein FlgE